MRVNATALVAALFACACAWPAHAVELHLRWDRCFEDGGAENRTFSCDTDEGEEALVASFRWDAPLSNVLGFTAELDIASVGDALPTWWQFVNPAFCRSGALTIDRQRPAGSANCADPGAGGALATLTGYYRYDTPPGSPSPNAAVLALNVDFLAPGGVTIAPGEETFAFRLLVDHSRTAAADSCEGCRAPMCLAWGRADLLLADGNVRALSLGVDAPGNRSNVTFQSGAVATTHGLVTAHQNVIHWVQCDTGVPVQPRTWGRIKRMYR